MANKTYATEWLTFENEIVLLRIATDYYKEDRYPNPNYSRF